MQERVHTRSRSEVSVPTSGLFDDADSAASTENELVMVTHGPYGESLPVAEMSVGEIRQQFRDRLDIHPEAMALVNGSPVDDQTTVRAGQLLMFVRRAGEKGVAA